jgi:hypothetical protein
MCAKRMPAKRRKCIAHLMETLFGHGKIQSEAPEEKSMV